MNYRFYLFITLSIVLFPVFARGQTSVTFTKKIPVAKPDSSYFLDYWVIEPTIKVSAGDSTLPGRFWHFHQETGKWSLNIDSVKSSLTNIVISYRVLPFNLKRQYYNRELVAMPAYLADSLKADSLKGKMGVIRSPITSDDLFGNAQIQKSGSLTRGIIIGNNQDFSLESGLRLDLSGQITNDINILAVLTDQSTPIQPDGSTQNLKQFDKVYIQMKSRKSAVQLGDISVKMNQSAFARIDRQLQGASFYTHSPYGYYSAAATVVRGKYREMKFNGIDGLQGPYRLTGANNEPFIIVQAGSEHVYIDGVLQTRGEENDYVIDYSLGEITFTNKRIITSATRITVDFQYLDQQYNRTLVAAEAQNSDLLNGKLSVGVTYIREADNDNPNAQLSLTDKEISVLRKAGNDPNKAVVSGVTYVGNADQSKYILYTRKDTTVGSSGYTIYENIPGSQTNQYQIQFSRVGDGNGDYQRIGGELNGVLYQWVGPGNGAYDTLRTITPPINHQMVSVRSQYHPNKHVEVYGEWAGNSLDKNRFSTIGNSTNFDNAYLVGTQMVSPKTDYGIFHFSVKQRYTGKRFTYFDRVKSVEFDRKWDITSDTASMERVTEMNGGWQASKNTSLDVGAGLINRSDFSGNRQDVNFISREKGMPQVNYYLERINSKDQYLAHKGDWVRQNGSLKYGIPIIGGTLTPVFAFEHEYRKQQDIQSDSLLNTSLRFIDFKPGVQYQLSDLLNVSASYSLRNDGAIANHQFVHESTALTQRYGLSLTPSVHFNSINDIAFRKKKYSEYFVKNQNLQNDNGVFIRSVSNYSPLHNFINGQLYYEANTERKALLQETYIDVGPEMGQYVWKDLNHDGIQQIDEFFLEQNPNEGTYIKQYIPSDQLLPVITLKTRFRNKIRPAKLINKDSDGIFSKILRNIEINSLFDIRETSTTPHLSDVYLLRLKTFGNDSTTLAERIYWRQEVQLFPDASRLNVRFSVERNTGQNKQTIGLEKQNSMYYRLYMRYRLKRRYIIENEIKLGKNKNVSQNLGSRNYNISDKEWNPKINIRVSSSYHTTFGITFSEKTDQYPVVPVRLTAFNILSENRIYIGNKTQIYLRLERRNNHLVGQSSGLGTFELTDGAGAGVSWLWNLEANYKISDLIRASLNYDGRTVSGNSPVQTLRFVVRAVF